MIPGRLILEEWPAAVYAIGDVHGCLAELLMLEHAIVADGADLPGEKWIVTLGDHIDRGSDSAAVIEHLLGPPPPAFKRFALMGNHERMMLDFLEDPVESASWLDQGGLETLQSYGIDVFDFDEDTVVDELTERLRAGVPAEHLHFMTTLPRLLSLPGWVFVHAGLRPGVPLDWQDDKDLIWIREPFLSAEPFEGFRVVHGHTPTDEPTVTEARIGLDTQCYATGRLTAVRVTPDGEIALLQTE
jgi:serine/threonine protein phosphatase 1